MMKRLNDKSVLIVDDDQRMLRALDQVLTGEGASVTAAEWAGDALGLSERAAKSAWISSSRICGCRLFPA